MNSSNSMFRHPDLSTGGAGFDPRLQMYRAASPEPRLVSMKSSNSMFWPPDLSTGGTDIDARWRRNNVLKKVKERHKSSMKNKLSSCSLGIKACENLKSVLLAENCSLIELDLSNNDLQDSGVDLLSAGLKSSHCKLQILRLSGYMVTETACCSLASALNSNPSQLKELDLTYNHPGEAGVKLLSARLGDPQCALSTLRVEHGDQNQTRTEEIFPPADSGSQHGTSSFHSV
ncbi:hypothetical protein AOLI_G00244030 [Acnodon oligacanthus]